MKHTDLFKKTLVALLATINEGLKKDDDLFFAGEPRMAWEEISYLLDLREQIENEQMQEINDASK